MTRRGLGLVAAAALALLTGCPEDEPEPRADERAAAEDPGADDQARANEEDRAPAVDRETAEALEALGYVPTTPTENPEERGVTTQGGRAAAGLNLYSSRREASAELVDMEGEVVHRWEAPDADDPHRRWMHVEPLESGALLTISKDQDVSKHAWDSALIWRRPLRAHHDLAVRDDGTILALTRDHDRLEHAGRTLPILADAVTLLSPEGEVKRTVELVPLMREHLDRGRLGRLARKVASGESEAELTRPGAVGDVLHTNSIAFLEHDIPGVAPAGSLVLSFRSLSRVAIVDAELSEVLWVWGEGELDAQHDATQTGSGNILLFDNGLSRGDSRVLEIDPRTGDIVWSHDPDGLYSRLRGGAQLLPNGHVLITESDRGHALEVTREGETVWEFWNPDVRGQGEDAERAIIYRLNRFPRPFFGPLGD